MNWESICQKHQLDTNFLKEFTPVGNVMLMQEEEFALTQEWLSAYALGAELLPIFTNNESDFVGVYTTGLLKGKVALVIHDDLDFTPVFSSIQSFLKIIQEYNFDDWYNIPKTECDYPIKEENQAEPNLLKECWKQIEANQFSSSEEKILICKMAISLTPPSQLNKLLVFVKSPFTDKPEHREIVEWAMYCLGVTHQYIPAKDLITTLIATKPYKHYPYKAQLYKGAFTKKSNIFVEGIIKILFFPIFLISFIVMIIGIAFAQLFSLFKKKNNS
jgi:hypothetical protein